MQPTTPQRDERHKSAQVNDVLKDIDDSPDKAADFESRYQGYELAAPTDTAETEATDQNSPHPAADGPEITWQASEYVHHEKDMSWFIIASIVTLALTAAALLFRQWTFAVLVVVMGAALIVYGRRPPRILHYAIGPRGIAVEQKEYNYEEFRAFGILQDGPLYSILLFPRKRFMPAVTMYFPDTEGERIVDALGAHLPAEPVELELIDKVTRKLRF